MLPMPVVGGALKNVKKGRALNAKFCGVDNGLDWRAIG